MAFEYIVSVSNRAILAKDEEEEIMNDLLKITTGMIEKIPSTPWYLTDGSNEEIYHLNSNPNILTSEKVKEIQEDFKRKKRYIEFFELKKVE